MGLPASSGSVEGSHFSFFCPKAFALMDPLPSNFVDWPAPAPPPAAGGDDLFAVVGLGPEGRQPGGVLDGYLVHYDPYSALESDLGATEELRSVSNNRLFVIDPSPHYETHPMLMSAECRAGYLGDSHSYIDYSSDSLPSLPGVGTPFRPNSRLPVGRWHAPSRVPRTCDVSVQAWGPSVLEEEAVTEHCGLNWRCFRGLPFCHFGPAHCDSCLAQEGGESAFSDSDGEGPLPIGVPSNFWLGDFLLSVPSAAVASAPVVRALNEHVDPIVAFASDSSHSLGAVRPAGHHSDSSQARFVGGAWYLGGVASPSSSAPRAEHLDPRGYDDYVYDELCDDGPDTPADAVAHGSGGGSSEFSSGSEEGLVPSSALAGASK